MKHLRPGYDLFNTATRIADSFFFFINCNNHNVAASNIRGTGMTKISYYALQAILFLIFFAIPLSAHAGCDYVDRSKDYPRSSEQNAEIFENIDKVYVLTSSTTTLQNLDDIYKPNNVSQIMFCALDARKPKSAQGIKYNFFAEDSNTPFFTRPEFRTPNTLTIWINVSNIGIRATGNEKKIPVSVSVSYIRPDLPVIQSAAQLCTRVYNRLDDNLNDEQLLTKALQVCAHAKLNEMPPKK